MCDSGFSFRGTAARRRQCFLGVFAGDECEKQATQQILVPLAGSYTICHGERLWELFTRVSNFRNTATIATEK